MWISLCEYENTNTYRSWCFDLLNWEIAKQKKKATTTKKQLDTDSARFTDTVSFLDSKCLLALIDKNTENKINKVSFIHNRKLLRLGIDLEKKVDKNKVIFNLSDRILTEEQKDALALGLDYCMPLSSIKRSQFFLHFEKLCYTLKNSPIYKNTWHNITNSISTIANDSFRLFKRQQTETQDPNPLLPPLKSLREDKNIIITKPDKGRGVVILNRNDYHNKLQTILDDRSKFKEINTDAPTHLLKMEDKLNRLLRSIKTSIGEAVYNTLTISGSVAGYLYGLPKIHKEGNPLRPIISAIGTFNYKLAKYLVEIITPLTTNILFPFPYTLPS